MSRKEIFNVKWTCKKQMGSVDRDRKEKSFRDVFSSFTVVSIINDERADSFREASLINTSLLRMSSTSIRVHNCPGFLAFKNDKILQSHGIVLDYG